jgi:hypothetical protein
LLGTGDLAKAQDGAGWYGPYADGCSYWWDGYQWTGDRDCANAAATYAAGWYGPFDDGCYWYWDGAAYTTSDCSAGSHAVSYPAGWYGPFDDGCHYYYDGAAYTGHANCAFAIAASNVGITFDAGTIGGSSFSSNIHVVPNATGPMVITRPNDPHVAVILSEAGTNAIRNILDPNCVEIVAGVCYTN